MKTIEGMFNKLFMHIYKKNSVIIISWIIASFHLTILYRYEKCINIYDEKDTVFLIFWLALTTIFLFYLPIIIYFYKNKNIIGHERIQEVQDEDGDGFGNAFPEVYILPIYVFMVFSLSKLIVVVYYACINSFTEIFFVKITILLIVFLSSLWAWCMFKKTSNKSWTFWITVFAISYVFVNIYWESVLPYIESYIKTLNCIVKSVVNS
ncbi:MAG: hypothetical protein ABXS93_04780 [Sulfurimonas sp.]